jgi:hypothetical protein
VFSADTKRDGHQQKEGKRAVPAMIFHAIKGGYDRLMAVLNIILMDFRLLMRHLPPLPRPHKPAMFSQERQARTAEKTEIHQKYLSEPA